MVSEVCHTCDHLLIGCSDVVEPNPDPSGQSLGGRLIVDGKYEFSDLDELIVNHVNAMFRRVKDLMAHEKFMKDEDELRKYIL